jgi:hypothetical protein
VSQATLEWRDERSRLEMVLLITALVALMALSAIPFLSRRRGWGNASRAGITVVLLIVLGLFLIGVM